jgi:hypothetical protein
MVVFYQNAVRQVKPVIMAAADADCVFFKAAEPGSGFSRIGDPGFRSGDGLDSL